MNRTYRKFNFPAFPVSPYCGDRENPPVKSNTGMSMRDFFASSALGGISATDIADNPPQAAKLAYELADAMMEILNNA